MQRGGDDDQEEDEETRVFAVHKLNVAGKPPSLRFALDVVSLPTVEQVPVLRLSGECDYSDEAVFEQAKRVYTAEPETELEAAMQYTVEALADGPRPSKPLFDAAAEEGFARRTMERARARLKCERISPAKLRERLGDAAYSELSEEDRRRWWIALPPTPDFPPEAWGS